MIYRKNCQPILNHLLPNIFIEQYLIGINDFHLDFQIFVKQKMNFVNYRPFRNFFIYIVFDFDFDYKKNFLILIFNNLEYIYIRN